MYKEQIVKPLLDLVTENTVGHFIKACQLEADEPFTAKHCRDIQTLHPLIEADWALVGPDTDKLDAAQVADCGLTQVIFREFFSWFTCLEFFGTKMLTVS